jgi:cytoskeleton protein RodZ
MPNTWKVVLLALALVLVVDGSLYYRYNRLFAQTPTSLASAFLEPASANPNGNGKDAAGAEKTTEDSVRATVRVNDSPSWLKITTDGAVAYEGIAEPGFSRSFGGPDSLSIWTGNAGAVEAQVDGRDLGTLGVDGEVLTRGFAAQPE